MVAEDDAGEGSGAELSDCVEGDWRFGRVLIGVFCGDRALGMTGEGHARSAETSGSGGSGWTTVVGRRGGRCSQQREKSKKDSAGCPEASNSLAVGAVFLFKKKTYEFERGIVRLYRHKPAESGVVRTPSDAAQEAGVHLSAKCGLLLCVVNIPSYISLQDFLAFVGPSQHSISRMYIIRDAKVERYMSLVCLRTKEGVSDFCKTYNNKRFVSFYPDECRIICIEGVKFAAYSEPNPRETGISSKRALLRTYDPAIAELPTCPVCLDRLDCSATGLITMVCSHTFHVNCIVCWDNTSCPVCRYSPMHMDPMPPTGSDSECSRCGIKDNLWICLICGQVGCGRYDGGHAKEHYSDTYHIYSMDLKTKSVWDYVEDKYIHRLIQNNADGKLVESQASSKAAGRDDHSGTAKGDTYPEEIRRLSGIYGLECTPEFQSAELSISFLAQLESQRDWYESLVSKISSECASKVRALEDRISELARDNSLLADENEAIRLKLLSQGSSSRGPPPGWTPCAGPSRPAASPRAENAGAGALSSQIEEIALRMDTSAKLSTEAGPGCARPMDPRKKMIRKKKKT